MPKQEEVNVGVEAMRIMEERGITFREAFRIAIDEKRAR